MVDQFPALVIQLAQVSWDGLAGGAFALEDVIEVGEVDEGEGGVELAVDFEGGVGDPAGRGDLGGGIRGERRRRGSFGRPPDTSAEASPSSPPTSTCCTTRRGWRR